VDKLLSHHEESPALFGPEFGPLERPIDWFTALGWTDPANPRHHHMQNERFNRYLVELCTDRYDLKRKKDVLKAIQTHMRTDDYFHNGGQPRLAGEEQVRHVRQA